MFPPSPGWQRKLVDQLRAGVARRAKLDEVVNGGHLVYLSTDADGELRRPYGVM